MSIKRLMFAFIFGILLIGLVNAGLTVDYKKDITTNKYGEITLKETFLGIPTGDYAKYVLNYNTDQCLVNCYAEGMVDLYKEGVIFSDLEFKDKLNRYIIPKTSNIYIYVNEEYTEQIPTYKEVCEDRLIVSNKTGESKIEKVCWNIEDKYNEVIKTRVVQQKYNYQTLKAGTYKWRIEGTKKPTESIDWLAQVNGKELSEWAWWNAGATKFPLTINTNGLIFDSNTTIFISMNLSDTNKFGSNDFNRTFLIYQDTIEIARDIVTTTGNQSIRFKLQANLNATANTEYAIYVLKSSDGTPKKRLNDVYWIGDNFDDVGGFNSTYWGVAGAGTNVVANSVMNVTSAGSYRTVGTAPTIKGNVTAELNASLANGCGWLLGFANTSTIGTYNGMGPQTLYIGEVGGGSIRFDYNRDLAGGANTYTLTRYALSYFATFKIEFNTTTQKFINSTGGGGSALTATINDNLFGFIFHPRDTGCTNDALQERIDYIKVYKTGILVTYSVGAEDEGNQLITTLNSPADTLITNNPAITFNCSATDETGVLNLTLKIDGINNYTITGGAGQNLSLQVSRSLADGNHNWTCSGCDSGACSTPTVRTLTVDTTKPTINILYPTNGTAITTFSIPFNVSFNATISDTNLNTCWYYNGTANNTVTCGNNATISTRAGYHTWIWYANDTANNVHSNSTTFLINNLNSTYSYDANVIEGENTTFRFNMSATVLSSGNATLWYNSIAYPMTQLTTSSTEKTFSRAVTAPLVNADTNIPFNFSYYINGVTYSTSTINQSVLNLTGFKFSNESCSDAGYQFVLKNEVNLSQLKGTINYNFKVGLSNASQVYLYGTIPEITGDLFICYNATIYSTINIGEGEIKYSFAGYQDRYYYIFDDTIMSNSTFQNVSLYSLETASATSFLLTVQSPALSPLGNKFISLLRWYVGEDTYRTVEMSKTDDKGQTVLRVKTEDVYYRIGVYERDGTLIKLINPIKFVCQTNPCTYNIYVEDNPLDLTSIFDLQQNLSWNNNTKTFTYIWNDPSGKTQSMNLSVYKKTGTAQTLVCSDYATGITGVLSCDVSTQTGTLVAKVTRMASPATVVSTLSAFIGIGELFTDIKGSKTLGLLLGVGLVLFLSLIAIFNPVVAIIMSVVALIPLIFLGNITFLIFGGFAVLAVIVLHFLRRIT